MCDQDHTEIDPINEDIQEDGGYSFPILTLWIVYGGLLIFIARISAPWGLVLHGGFLLIVGLFLRMAFSEKDFEKARQMDSRLTPYSWKFNYILFFVLIPLAVWVGLMTMRGWRF